MIQIIYKEIGTLLIHLLRTEQNLVEERRWTNFYILGDFRDLFQTPDLPQVVEVPFQ